MRRHHNQTHQNERILKQEDWELRKEMNDCQESAKQAESVPRQYYLLVDFDNLAINVFGGWKHNRLSPHVLFDLVRRLDLQSPFFENVVSRSRVKLRLYGGWYFCNRLSFAAQNIQKANMIGGLGVYSRGKAQVFVQSEFAHNLSSLENSHSPLYATFRHVRLSACPLCHTAISVNDDRQKMVDTMLCCDLLYLGQQANTSVAIVTSDDDLIPPLLQQASDGKPVYHMLTTQNQSGSFIQYYQTHFNNNYYCIPY